MHRTIEPAIFYLGTPVLVISTVNEDGSSNLAPMSSAWWLGWSCAIGLDGSSQTTENLQRSRQCVLNLAGVDNASQVNALAKLTGRRNLPVHKKALGYRYCKDKFAAAGLSASVSELVDAKRIAEFPIHLEAEVTGVHTFGSSDDKLAIPACFFELKILRAHVQEELIDPQYDNRIDPEQWRPLIMSFRKFFGLSGQVHESKLSEGGEEDYAPWKQSGLTGAAKRAVVKAATRKYRLTDT